MICNSTCIYLSCHRCPSSGCLISSLITSRVFYLNFSSDFSFNLSTVAIMSLLKCTYDHIHYLFTTFERLLRKNSLLNVTSELYIRSPIIFSGSSHTFQQPSYTRHTVQITRNHTSHKGFAFLFGASSLSGS